jgi:hypothetical protein
LVLIVGFGFYPNLGTADAYAISVHDGLHTTVRAHRALGGDRSYIGTGPLRAEVIEPFREWRLVGEDNDQGLSFDLRWYDTKRAVFQQMGGGGMTTTANGRLRTDTVGYETFGRIEGTVTHGEHSWALDRATTWGSRDHHWGARNGVGGPGHMEPQPRWSHLGQWVEFGDWSIWGWRCLYNLGSPRPGAVAVQAVDHLLRFDPETRHLTGGVITNRFPDGTIKEIAYEQIGMQVGYLRCGMYPSPNGGTPEEDYYQGMYVADLAVGGETYDLSDPATRVRIAGFDDHLVRASCDGEETIGILECMNPVIYEMCRDAYPGFRQVGG